MRRSFRSLFGLVQQLVGFLFTLGVQGQQLGHAVQLALDRSANDFVGEFPDTGLRPPGKKLVQVHLAGQLAGVHIGAKVFNRFWPCRVSITAW